MLAPHHAPATSTKCGITDVFGILSLLGDLQVVPSFLRKFCRGEATSLTVGRVFPFARFVTSLLSCPWSQMHPRFRSTWLELNLSSFCLVYQVNFIPPV